MKSPVFLLRSCQNLRHRQEPAAGSRALACGGGRKEGTHLCVTHFPGSAPAARAAAPTARAQPVQRLWPLTLPACRSSGTGSRPIWLSRTPRTRQGEQGFRSRWMMSSTMQLAAAEVASIAACSSYGITFFGVLLKNISYLLHFVQGNLKYFLLSA